MVSPRPDSCAVAFKEWAGVCDALIQGRQSLIVRKGGISEGAGPGTFVPEHSEFWLYPTWVHQAEQGLRGSGGTGPPAHPVDPGGAISIRALVRVGPIGYVESEETLPELEEFHIFTAETIVKRFRYRQPGLWVLGARVWRHDPGFVVAASPEHAGCKTWVNLDEPLPTTALSPVLDEAEWTAVCRRLRAILEGG
ncbi:MAG: DUF1802 family protein [Isosphaerales bacterium]